MGYAVYRRDFVQTRDAGFAGKRGREEQQKGPVVAVEIEVVGVSKSYGDRRVLENVSLAAEAGETLVLLGASGCGKTTLLAITAGFERPDSGEVRLAGRRVAGGGEWVPPHKRGLSLVFQHQALWPHLSVYAHLDFVLKAQHVPRRERRSRIVEQLSAVRLTGHDRKLPAQLSGGEAQRLSLARALVGRPRILLLDEPCANLDTSLRRSFVELFKEIQRARQVTAVYVTHDAFEAFAVADRLAVLNAGKVVRTGTPQAVCETPAGPEVTELLSAGIAPPGWWRETPVARHA